MCSLTSNGLNVQLYCPLPADVAVQDQQGCVVLNYNLLGHLFHVEVCSAN